MSIQKLNLNTKYDQAQNIKFLLDIRVLLSLRVLSIIHEHSYIIT